MNSTIWIRIVLLIGVSGILAACGGEDAKEKITGDRISVLSYEKTLRVDPRLADRKINLRLPFRNQSWTQPGGVPTHAIYHLALEDTKRAFQTALVEGNHRDARIITPPLVADGRIYAVGAELDLAAADAKSGEIIWQQSLLSDERIKNTGFTRFLGFKDFAPDTTDGFGAGIAYGNGNIYAVTGFGELLALNGQTGAILWRVKNVVPFSNAPTVRDNRIFVVAQDSRLHVFSAIDGTRLWDYLSITEPADILSASSPAVNDQVVIAGFNSGEVTALQVQNGTQNWSDSLTSRALQITPLSEINTITARPVIDRDRVFVSSHGGRTAAIDVRTGERVWTADIGSIETLWVMGDYILVLSIDSRLVCLSRNLGRVRWVTQLPRYEDEEEKEGRILWTGPVVAGGKIIIASSQGEIALVSPFDGTLLERFALEAGDDTPVSVPPIVADGMLYVLNDAGMLYGFQ